MKYSILAIVVLLVISFPLAGAAHQAQSIQYYVNNYNNKLDSAPDILKGLVGNEKVNINITEPDGSVSRIGIETQNGRIVNTADGGYSDPNIVVTTTRDAINNINNSSDPVATFQDEQKYGQVVIAGTDFGTRVKLGVLLSSLPVLKFFSNIFYG